MPESEKNPILCTEEFLWLSLEKKGKALPFLLRGKHRGGEDDGVHVWRSLSVLDVPSAWVFCRSRTWHMRRKLVDFYGPLNFDLKVLSITV